MEFLNQSSVDFIRRSKDGGYFVGGSIFYLHPYAGGMTPVIEDMMSGLMIVKINKDGLPQWQKTYGVVEEEVLLFGFSLAQLFI